MRRRGFIFLVCLSWCMASSLLAQNADIDKIMESYKLGQLDKTYEALTQNMTTFEGAEKVQAYRLLSLTCFALDRFDEAKEAAGKLLVLEPYYTPAWDDPAYFKRLIDSLKGSKNTIVSASRQAETLEEAPVPVTLITEEMIKAIGARTLKDVLITYVPGMTSVESPNEVNVAMHGVYSAGQEKILIMLNGQRMNARVTNKAAPDYSISLDKIKRIEVLRGPASSLYGNVALMAVVNLITKEGSEINGLEAAAGFGNFGQKKASLLIGKHITNMDFMGWASFYASNGQKRFVSAAEAVGANPHDGYVWTEAYNHLPSYDFGLTFKWNKLSLIFNQRYGKKVPPYADIHTSMGALYDYDRYKVINGEAPGHGMSFTHAGMTYSDQIKNVDLEASVYFDLNRSNQYSLIGDGESGTLGSDTTRYYSFFQIMDWSEYSVGGTVLANYAYPQLGRLGNGNLLVGMQMEYMRLYGAEGLVGSDFTNIFMHWPTNPVQLGAESTYSPFMQLKHSFSRKWILNAGVRYDIKHRVSDQVVTSLSPRISLIFLPTEKMSLKLIYAKSFVDAPYFYRYNQSPSYKGPEDMEPEYLEAVQGSFTYRPIPALSYNGVIFYNNLTGLIYRDQSAEGDEPRYINAGELRSVGIENSLQYQVPRFMANFNVTYQTVLDGNNYSFSGHQIYNVPNWYMNLSLNGNLVKKEQHELWLYANSRLTGEQLSPIDNVLIGGELVRDLDNSLPAVFTMNAGARYRFRNVELELSFYNLLDKTYYQGGSTSIPYIQQGFSLMGTLRYILRK